MANHLSALGVAGFLFVRMVVDSVLFLCALA